MRRFNLDIETLLHATRVLNTVDNDLQRLGFCWDVYVEFVHYGKEDTEHMNAARATQQLEEAVCAMLGIAYEAPAELKS